MNSSSATAMDQIGKYWGMWGARRSSSSSSTIPISAWAAAYGGSSEPSWEEQAFARDAAEHLGGCVWPPRSYSCTFCQREFRSAQALGGHMNVHRRDRALLRLGGSSSPEDVHATTNDQPHPQQGALLYRAAASNPSTTTPSTTAAGPAAAITIAGAGDGDANTTTTTTYLSRIIKESKNKRFMPMPDHSVAEMREDQAAAIDDHRHHEDGDSWRSASAAKKRRRLDHPLATAAALLIFVQPAPKAATDVAACESQGGADHETKVPHTTTLTSPSSSSPLLLDQRHELDLELRLGTTPKVTYIHGNDTRS
jgi:hypothetical protein